MAEKPAGRGLERNQNTCSQSSLVKGRRSFHPTVEDLSAGTAAFRSGRVDLCGFGVKSLWFRYSLAEGTSRNDAVSLEYGDEPTGNLGGKPFDGAGGPEDLDVG